MNEDAETRPQDQHLWEQWERHSTPDNHLRSPRRITEDGRWQRWCSCGWRGPLCEDANQARLSHFTHLATDCDYERPSRAEAEADPAALADDDELVDRLCEVMHDAYEAAAITQGWRTQDASRKPWAEVPEANKATMRVAVRALAAALTERTP